MSNSAPKQSAVDTAADESAGSVLARAELRLAESEARIATLLQEHRLLRHRRFREENIRILKLDAAQRSAPQQERIDHLVAARENRSGALPTGSYSGAAAPCMPKHIRATAFAGCKIDEDSANATADAAGATGTPRRRFPVKSTLAHVINTVEPPHRGGVHRVAGAVRGTDLSNFTMVFDDVDLHKPSEVQKQKEQQQAHKTVLQRTVPASDRGGDVPFDRTKHCPGDSLGASASTSARKSVSFADFSASGGHAAATSNALAARRRQQAGQGRFKIEPPTAPRPDQMQGVGRFNWVARELNKNSDLMKPADQFARTETFETVSHGLWRYQQMEKLKAAAAGRTKFDVSGSGDGGDGGASSSPLAPPAAEAVVVPGKDGGPPRHFVRAGAYLIADRRRDQWRGVDEHILASCPSRGLPKVSGVTDNETGYVLMTSSKRIGGGGADNDDGRRSVVSDLTATSVGSRTPRR